MKFIILILFLYSCTNEKNNISSSGKFKQIDEKLYKLADELDAEIGTKGGEFYKNGIRVLKSYEIRRIVWFDGALGKGILISPNFGIDADTQKLKWDFINIAWLNEDSSGSVERPFRQDFLLRNVEFYQIEKNIDDLLQRSLDNLKNIEMKDLNTK